MRRFIFKFVYIFLVALPSIANDVYAQSEMRRIYTYGCRYWTEQYAVEAEHLGKDVEDYLGLIYRNTASGSPERKRDLDKFAEVLEVRKDRAFEMIRKFEQEQAMTKEGRESVLTPELTATIRKTVYIAMVNEILESPGKSKDRYRRKIEEALCN